IGGAEVNVNLTDQPFRQTVIQMLPGLAAVRALVYAALRSRASADDRPRLAFGAPRSGVNLIRIGGGPLPTHHSRLVLYQKSTFTHVSPPSLVRKTPRSTFGPNGCPNAATKATLASRGSTRSEPICPTSRRPACVHVLPASVDL